MNNKNILPISIHENKDISRNIKYNGSNNVKIKKFVQIDENNQVYIPQNMDVLYNIEIKADKIEHVECMLNNLKIMDLYDIKRLDDEMWNINFSDIILGNTFPNYILLKYCSHIRVKFIFHGENINKVCIIYGYVYDFEKLNNYRNINNMMFKYDTQYKFRMNNSDKINISQNFENYYTTQNPIVELVLEVEEGELKSDRIIFQGEFNFVSIFNRNNIKYVNDRKIVINGFDHRFFLYRNTKLIFDKKISSNVILTTKTLNEIVFRLNYIFLRVDMNKWKRIINQNDISFFEKIDENLYFDKVVPKKNDTCAISYEKFDEGDTIIICKTCFMSYKEYPIKLWMSTNEICPHCRSKNGFYSKIFRILT